VKCLSSKKWFQNAQVHLNIIIYGKFITNWGQVIFGPPVYSYPIYFAGMAHLESVPDTLTTTREIRDYLRECMEGTEEWRAMRIIVLGHGRIGKTTLICSIQDILVSSLFYHSCICLFGILSLQCVLTLSSPFFPTPEICSRNQIHCGHRVQCIECGRYSSFCVGFRRAVGIHSYTPIFLIIKGSFFFF
jgi:hypothetical protein